ncbi:PhnD/SsuA/transferrin family substrate-binding protein [bacterium]|nr:PhnD/SsuA/transferrin family substrate-binding protein [bacterium]
MKVTPLLEYLSKELTKKLPGCYQVDLVILPTYEAGQRAIIDGVVDVMRLGVASFVKVSGENKKVHVIATEKRIDSERLHGAIIVNSDATGVEYIRDLEGKSFAFGNPESTTGNFLAKFHLTEHGITRADLGEIKSFGMHKEVFDAVALDDFDAGAMKYTAVTRYNSDGDVKVIYKFYSPSKVWVAAEHVPHSLIKTIRGIMLRINSPVAMDALKISAFETYRGKDYIEAREAIRTEYMFDRSALAKAPLLSSGF